MHLLREILHNDKTYDINRRMIVKCRYEDSPWRTRKLKIIRFLVFFVFIIVEHTKKWYDFDMVEYRRTKTIVSLINYYFVFCPIYRRKIFIKPKLDKCFKELIYQIAQNQKFNIIVLGTDKDYCHLFLNALPMYSPVNIMAKAKGELQEFCVMSSQS